MVDDRLGISFEQRNAIVVGIAMGLAVIPNIFSIAEDAVFSVPKHLTMGSLALGATPWQTMKRVVLLTASPGIFVSKKSDFWENRIFHNLGEINHSRYRVQILIDDTLDSDSYKYDVGFRLASQ